MQENKARSGTTAEGRCRVEANFVLIKIFGRT